jgi:hypothetical protein
VVARRIALRMGASLRARRLLRRSASGNLLIQDDGSLSVIDFGKVGRLAPETRRRVADMFIDIARSDAERLTDRLIEVTVPSRLIDRDALMAEIDRMPRYEIDRMPRYSWRHVSWGWPSSCSSIAHMDGNGRSARCFGLPLGPQ